MTDLAELIQADHVRISEVIGQFDGALTGPGPAGVEPEAILAWNVLAGFLRLHVAADEEIAYVALASADPGVRPAVSGSSSRRPGSEMVTYGNHGSYRSVSYVHLYRGTIYLFIVTSTKDRPRSGRPSSGGTDEHGSPHARV